MSKHAMRLEARARLGALPPGAREAAIDLIAAAVWTLPEVAGAGTLLLFAGRDDEVATDGIAREAVRRGMRIAYPLIGAAAGVMTLHTVSGPEVLRPGRHRIPEPEPDTPRLAIGEVDAALVPGLAWDRAGGRLGRGAGYFDRLFADAAWRGFRCGVFLACQEVPSVPRDPWDAPLHAVVTEREVWRG